MVNTGMIEMEREGRWMGSMSVNKVRGGKSSEEIVERE